MGLGGKGGELCAKNLPQWIGGYKIKVKVTPQELEEARTPAGGWTRKTLASWGIPWPPPKGWKKEVLGLDEKEEIGPGRVLTQRAKANRRKPTKAELKFKKDLLRMKIKFRSQRPIDWYIADFILPKWMIVVEIDGEYHQDKDQVVKDRIRQKYIEKQGFKVYRLTNEQVFNSDYEAFLAWLDEQEPTTETNWRKIYGQPKF